MDSIAALDRRVDEMLACLKPSIRFGDYGMDPAPESSLHKTHALRVVLNIPNSLRGKWCVVGLNRKSASQFHQLFLQCQYNQIDEPAEMQNWMVGLGLPRTIIYIPADAIAIVSNSMLQTLDLYIKHIGKMCASLLIFFRDPKFFAGVVTSSPSTALRRFRRHLSFAARRELVPKSYQLWRAAFDYVRDGARERFMNSNNRALWPTIDVFIFRDSAIPADLRSTLSSVTSQWLPCNIIHDLDSVNESKADYIAILQDGEVLRSFALALLASKAHERRPPFLCGDTDIINSGKMFVEPHFAPRLNHSLMLSGAFLDGVWLVRRDIFDTLNVDTGDAYSFRLSLWLTLWRARRHLEGLQIPHVLSSRAPGDRPRIGGAVARVIEQHEGLVNLGITLAKESTSRIVWTASSHYLPMVEIIIASRCDHDIKLRCIKSILNFTSYPNFKVCLVLAQPNPPDSNQMVFIENLGNSNLLRVLHVPMGNFNFSVANNVAVQAGIASIILLLNDDVETRSPDWLHILIGHLNDQRVGIVGSKLLYPDCTVQHNGMILGMGRIAGHACLMLPQNAPGHAGMNLLDREVSAVTGACLLTRRSIYEAVNGLDESFPTAFNDVDFCLRVRNAGWTTVVATQRPLVHIESLTFGSHYGTAEREREMSDIRRMRDRWKGVLCDDPYHSPNLSLTVAADDRSAFPPRSQLENLFWRYPGSMDHLIL